MVLSRVRGTIRRGQEPDRSQCRDTVSLIYRCLGGCQITRFSISFARGLHYDHGGWYAPVWVLL